MAYIPFTNHCLTVICKWDVCHAKLGMIYYPILVLMHRDQVTKSPYCSVPFSYITQLSYYHTVSYTCLDSSYKYWSYVVSSVLKHAWSQGICYHHIKVVSVMVWSVKYHSKIIKKLFRNEIGFCEILYGPSNSISNMIPCTKYRAALHWSYVLISWLDGAGNACILLQHTRPSSQSYIHRNSAHYP